ncbi:MAG TPA: UPF0182 family protein, partial [Dehalococcoidia bacterium]
MTRIADHEDLGPPPGPFRFRTSRGRGFRRVLPWLAVLAALIILFAVLSVGKSIYADLLWFDSVGYRSVYTKRIVTSVWLFAAGGFSFLAIFLTNVMLARRLAPATDDPNFQMSPEFRELAEELRSGTLHRLTTIGMISLALLIALAFATSAAGHWDDILLFSHSQSFGMKDPQFHHDLSFYVFKLPVYGFIVNWLTAALIVTIVGVAAVYVFRTVLYGFRIDGPRPIARELFHIDVPRPIKL